MGEAQSKSRDAAVLMEAGISELRQKSSPTAQIYFGAAKTMFEDAGDTFNAGVARQWLDTAKAR